MSQPPVGEAWFPGEHADDLGKSGRRLAGERRGEPMDYVSETDPLSQRFSGRAHINAPSAEIIRQAFRGSGDEGRTHVFTSSS